MENKNYIDKILDFVFSKNNVKYLIILFVIAFILRIIAANNLAPNADEMVHGTHALGIIESKKLQIMDQDAIWFYLTDLFYRIFGENLIGLRFMSILFGSLSIFLVYLIAKKLFNERTALIAAFILTFSSYHIVMSLAEMDTSMIFFVLFSIYFFIKAVKENKDIFYILSNLFLGIAIMIKQIALLFIPAFILFLIYYKIKNSKFKINWKILIYSIILILILLIPIFTFNYLLYKDKGLVDLQFSRFLGVAKDTYKSIEATLKPFNFKDLFFPYENHPAGLYEGLSIIFRYSPLILILGLIGIIISYKRNKDFTLLILISFLIPFIFLSGTSLLPIHFIFAVPLLAIFNSNLLDFLMTKLQNFKIKTKIILYFILIAILVLSFIKINNEGIFAGKNEITKVISFKNNNIKDDSLVIVDSRIYRGRIALSFNDKHYLEASNLDALLKTQDSLQGELTSIDTYFIECITDDCGWGTINSQPEFNKSMEDIVNFVKNNSKYIATIKNSYGEDYFNIYNMKSLLKPSSLELADTTHDWFYYPLRYKKESFDDYKVNGFFDKILDRTAHYVLYLELLIALLTPIFLFFLLFKEKDET